MRIALVLVVCLLLAGCVDGPLDDSKVTSSSEPGGDGAAEPVSSAGSPETGGAAVAPASTARVTKLDWSSNLTGPFALRMRVREAGSCSVVITGGVPVDYATPVVWFRPGDPGLSAGTRLVPGARVAGQATADRPWESEAFPFSVHFAPEDAHWNDTTATFGFPFVKPAAEEPLKRQSMMFHIECSAPALITMEASRQVVAGGLDLFNCKEYAYALLVDNTCKDGSATVNLTGSIVHEIGCGLVDDCTIQGPGMEWTTADDVQVPPNWHEGPYHIRLDLVERPPDFVPSWWLIAGFHPVTVAGDLARLPQ